ncbi:MAG: cell division protein FtsX [Flavobacteriaceae bacterium]|nr:cell division protein FtsX [Flavobacteriaceae bacterium]|tara:strand:- start:1633 stop:2505 length:873 start_codon:yes stop_codon:yes gene_type:complete
MNTQSEYQKTRLISSYFSVTLSIALVIFILGILGILLINSQKIESHFKEQISFTIYISELAKPIQIKQLQKSLKLKKGTKNVKYISKEKAAEIHAESIGEDFIEFLGYNPLLNSIEVRFFSKYVSPVFLEKLKISLENENYINEVYYDVPLIELLDKNIKKISQGLVATTITLLLIAILLINSSIRISIYSKRLVIKTMQLVGATKNFIIRPFLVKYLILGFYGSFIAILSLLFTIYFVNNKYPELDLSKNFYEITIVFLIISILSFLITGISSFFATERFLNLKTNEVN